MTIQLPTPLQHQLNITIFQNITSPLPQNTSQIILHALHKIITQKSPFNLTLPLNATTTTASNFTILQPTTSFTKSNTPPTTNLTQLSIHKKLTKPYTTNIFIPTDYTQHIPSNITQPPLINATTTTITLPQTNTLKTTTIFSTPTDQLLFNQTAQHINTPIQLPTPTTNTLSNKSPITKVYGQNITPINAQKSPIMASTHTQPSPNENKLLSIHQEKPLYSTPPPPLLTIPIEQNHPHDIFDIFNALSAMHFSNLRNV